MDGLQGFTFLQPLFRYLLLSNPLYFSKPVEMGLEVGTPDPVQPFFRVKNIPTTAPTKRIGANLTNNHSNA